MVSFDVKIPSLKEACFELELLTFPKYLLAGMLSAEHVVLHAFVGKAYPHYCEIPLSDRSRISTMSLNNWTEENFRDFYVPSKPRDDPPQIGEAFYPCRRYHFNNWTAFADAHSFSDAVKLRDAVLSNEKSKAARAKSVAAVRCDGRYHYEINPNEFKGGVQQEVS